MATHPPGTPANPVIVVQDRHGHAYGLPAGYNVEE